MLEQDIQEQEVTIEDAKERIALRDGLIKLTKNREFKKIIETGYFEAEAARVVAAKANPALQGAEQQLILDKQINAIGGLRQYFGMIVGIGNQAEQALGEHIETLEAMRQEDLEGQEQ